MPRPKEKRKGKSDRGRNEGSLQTSDDESINDNFSIISNCSENHSVDDGSEETDEFSEQETFEDNLTAAIEGLTLKSAQARIECLDSLRNGLVKKYVPDYVYNRRVTILDAIERSFRKGRSEEQAAAAILAPLLCVQLGVGDASEKVCQDLKPLLLTIANNKSVSFDARAKCCRSLGLVTFLAGGEMGDVLDLMHQFEGIFRGSYLKGDDSVPNVSPEIAALHSAALSAWTLLFTLMSPGDVYSMLNTGSKDFVPSLVQLSGLLMSPNLEVRLTAGEALATVFELGREFNPDFADEIVPELVVVLNQLATDSQKHRARKDRKQQRATFRDILHFIRDDEMMPLQVKFGKEVLALDSWLRRKQYNALCHNLGPGLNRHLTENELLRDIFELGDKILIDETPNTKQEKRERRLMNAAAFKARTISRGKNRDKRSDFSI